MGDDGYSFTAVFYTECAQVDIDFGEIFAEIFGVRVNAEPDQSAQGE
jgi:hypothetical protein